MGLSQIGFFFGAGSSFAAGYPLTSKLTTHVLKKLSSPEIELIEKILKKKGQILDVEKGEPDIEILSDFINRASTTGGYKDIDSLTDSIRKYIVDVINEVAAPNLEYHIKFLKGLKSRLQNRNEPIWIFTTNYDLCFEMAAAKAHIPVHNGFEGIANRYFDIERLDLKYGKVDYHTRKFEPFKEPHIILVKLHGSISWFKDDVNTFESFLSENAPNRCMILPRRTKVIETLEAPYDKLFRYASSIIGNQCKFIVSCGYSYRDEHINDILFVPKLNNRSLRLFALSKDETPEMSNLKEHPSFHYLVNDKVYYNKNEQSASFNLWDFKKFADLF